MRQLICKTVVDEPSGLNCGGKHFIQVFQLGLLSPVESKSGTQEIAIQPGYQCTECGAVLDLESEIKKGAGLNGVHRG